MLKKMKDYIVGSLVTLLVLGGTGTAMAAYNRTLSVTYSDIKLNVNGSQVIPKDPNGNVVEPFIYNGTTYLPVRAVSEALSCRVDWDQSSKTVYINGLAPNNNGGTSGNSNYNPGSAIVQNLIDVIQPYQSDLATAYPNNGEKSILMGGIEYKNSLKFSQYLSKGFAAFNLGGKYTLLSGIAGITDDGYTGSDVTLTFTTDGTIAKTLTLKEGNLPQNFSLDVTGVSQLRIDKVGGTTAGLAELKIQ